MRTREQIEIEIMSLDPKCKLTDYEFAKLVREQIRKEI